MPLFKKSCRCGVSEKHFVKDIGEFFIGECCEEAGYDYKGDLIEDPCAPETGCDGKCDNCTCGKGEEEQKEEVKKEEDSSCKKHHYLDKDGNSTKECVICGTKKKAGRPPHAPNKIKVAK